MRYCVCRQRAGIRGIGRTGAGAAGMGMRRQELFGRQLAEDFRRDGFPCDRLAPMRNTYLFGKWQSRNKIPTSAIVQVGDRLHPDPEPTG